MTVKNEPLLLGIEIGGSKLQLLAAVSPTRILHRQRLPVDRGTVAHAIQDCVEAALAHWAGTCKRQYFQVTLL
jgi:predicted NBD/HSP70 family sugar kinase